MGSGPGSLGGPGPDAATLEAVRKKYSAAIDDPEPSTRRHVILTDGTPVGLIQYTRLEQVPEYAASIGEVERGGAGIDLFIGEVRRVSNGLGSRVLDAYAREVVFADPEVTRAIGAPHPENGRSCRAFEKAGFTRARDVMAPDEGPERVHVRYRG